MFEKERKVLTLLISIFILFVNFNSAQNISKDNVWKEISDSQFSKLPVQRLSQPNTYKIFQLNKSNLKLILEKAPKENLMTRGQSDVVLTLPMPDGKFQRFAIEDSPIMEPELAAKFPELKTYKGYGIDDRTATGRFSFTPNGFRGMILSAQGTIYVDPYAKGDTVNYISFNKKHLERKAEDQQYCLVGNGNTSNIFSEYRYSFGTYDNLVTNGETLRRYRLAVAATFEYSEEFESGTVDGVMIGIMDTINRVNVIFERDLAVRFDIVADNNLIIYTDDSDNCGATRNQPCTADNDPYTNNNNVIIKTENQTNLDAVIGSANYDIGHVFSFFSEGDAVLKSTCDMNTKAQAVSGSLDPTSGDPFDVDVVAHQIGHQLGANHTFNSTAGRCGNPGERNAATAFETASGSTIMGFAGMCGNENLQLNSDDYFHIASLEEIVAFISDPQTGGACSANSGSPNIPPSVDVVGGPTFEIPKETPFELTASGVDDNGDTLIYTWEEFDLGPAGLPAPNIDAPIFRSYFTTEFPTRTFPSLPYILEDENDPPATYSGTSPTGAVCSLPAVCITGEVLPNIGRTMQFQVTARDLFGGIDSAMATVNVDANSGPFKVTFPNTSVLLAGGSQVAITWDVSNTTNPPVSADKVRISFSMDNGESFPLFLDAETPNDGEEVITIPNVGVNNTGRIKIQGLGKIFFDISDEPFSISKTPIPCKSFMDFDADGRTDISVFRPTPAEWWILNSSTGTASVFQFGQSTDQPAPADYTGDGKTDIAFFRPGSGEWFVLRSEDNSFFSFPFGTNGDIPIPGDYDGDRKEDFAVFRPSTATWFILKSTGGTTIREFGSNGDVPLNKDFDGDCKTDLAIYRPSVSEWFYEKSTDMQVLGFQFGSNGDKPVPSDYTGDGKDDIAFFRPTSGEWFVLRSEDSSFFAFPFGVNGDIPAPGDYDGDGTDDPTVFRPSNSTWFSQTSTAGFQAVQFGIIDDVPLPSAFTP